MRSRTLTEATHSSTSTLVDRPRRYIPTRVHLYRAPISNLEVTTPLESPCAKDRAKVTVSCEGAIKRVR
eukprot:896512-Rhodomonas_salina.1